MKNIETSIVIALIIFLNTNFAKAQTENGLVKFETKDGNQFIGRIISEDSTKVVIETEFLGEIPINKTAITRRTEIDSRKMVEGKLWDDNPQATRYLWTPNGYGLKKGEGYYQNIWVLYNQISYGITNNISASVGTIPLFLFGSPVTPVWVIPKFSIPIEKDKLNLSLGVFAGTIIGEKNTSFGLAFGNVTYGDRNQNITLGTGWGYSPNGWASTPLINLSGMVRLSANGYFLTENYFLPTGDDNNFTLLSAGGRYMINKVGLDFGLYIPITPEIGALIAIPMLGITVPFYK